MLDIITLLLKFSLSLLAATTTFLKERFEQVDWTRFAKFLHLKVPRSKNVLPVVTLYSPRMCVVIVLRHYTRNVT